jgi:predicted nucleic acid-binding protein
MVIVDTSVWVEYLRGSAIPETRWLDRALGREAIGLTDLILCEVLQGVRSDSEFRTAKRELLQLSVFPSGGVDLALEAAGHFRDLRQRGFTVRKMVDCWIATFCLREGYRLLHCDRDYDLFERHLGLRVAHP